jgi:hypothetical protein
MAYFRAYVVLVIAILAGPLAFAQTDPIHGERPDALVIRNVTYVDGAGVPARGPATIILKDGIIDSILGATAPIPKMNGDVRIIDGTGKYALPGFINMHAHIHGPWGFNSLPLQFIYNLWLACGITTVRDVGSVETVTLEERARSAAGEIDAPRIFAYLWFPSRSNAGGLNTAERLSDKWLREEVRRLKKAGADGMKVRHFDRDTITPIMDEAKKQGLRVAHHVGVEDFDALDNAALGTTTIEHWYGIPEAAIPGVQEFPADFTYANELLRFRYAGRVWREADPERLDHVLRSLVDSDVGWNPTFAIYEAARDLQRALTQPAFRDYLHPALADYFEPDPSKHGSFFFGWTNTDEVYWRENYRIWMDAVKDFSDMGGLVTTGEDAGFIYQLFGFCYLRELQLHEEAGFHPIEVIEHATHNGAIALGKEDELGRIRPGHKADIVVVNGNPLENLQVLMPRGLNETLDAQSGGGIVWTIKDGIPYHSETLLEDARAIVAEARKNE